MRVTALPVPSVRVDKIRTDSKKRKIAVYDGSQLLIGQVFGLQCFRKMMNKDIAIQTKSFSNNGGCLSSGLISVKINTFEALVSQRS